MLSYENHPGMAPPTPPNSDLEPLAAARRSSASSAANGSSAAATQRRTENHHIFLITGPAGSGKSTVAQHVARSLNLPYIEGDEYHPPPNVEKMSKGIPLTDADRWDWLTVLREEALRQLEAGAPAVVVTCSALKRKYRDVIRVAPYYSHDVRVHFVYLRASEEVLLQRVLARKGHYMGANMVHSQFGILEAPADDETDVLAVDGSGTMDAVQELALQRVRAVLDEERRAR